MRPDNLPIPLFLHHDDIEFGIRNQKAGIVFLNGFGVWHKGFELTFTGVNTYYDVRNTLITTALNEQERSQTEILKWIWKRITVDIIEFRYGEMRLAYQAFYDFCRGPEWLYKTDAEKLNNWLREQVAMKPIENLKGELGEEYYCLLYTSFLVQVNEAGELVSAEGILGESLGQIVRKRIRKRVVTLEIPMLGAARRVELAIRVKGDENREQVAGI